MSPQLYGTRSFFLPASQGRKVGIRNDADDWTTSKREYLQGKTDDSTDAYGLQANSTPGPPLTTTRALRRPRPLDGFSRPLNALHRVSGYTGSPWHLRS